MSINLNNYNYSYANAIGNTLKQPLFKLVSNFAIAYAGKPWESEAWRITRIAFHCLIAAVFVIPVGSAWLIGKSISYFSKTQIDPDGLSLAPSQIEIPEELASDESIDIRFLAKRFDQLNVIDTRSSDQTSKKESLHRLCDWVATENPKLYPDHPETRKLFCKQMSIFLKDIIEKIEFDEISKDKERDILMELAEASTRCYPTWLEAAARLFAEVNGQEETTVKLLRLVQEYKEFLTLEFSQKEIDAQWHALNYVRNVLGRELGFNTTLNAHDVYAVRDGTIFEKYLTKWLFLQRYENANRLISAIHTKINFQDYVDSYNKFLIEIIKQQGIENPEDYVQDHFYNGYTLKEQGVNLMLRSIGIIK